MTVLRGGSELTVTETQTNPPMEISGRSKLIVNGTLTCPEVTLCGGTLSGTGTVIGNVVTKAGDTVSSEVTVNGSVLLDQSSTSSFSVPGAGEDPSPWNVGGTASLGGTIRPETGKTLPELGTQFQILDADSVLGTFDRVDHSHIGGRIGFSVDYTPTTVSLTANYETYPGYLEWRDKNFHGAARADVLISGPNADPDGDGMTNLQEYVHATPPRVANPSPVKLRVANALFLELTFPWADGMEDASFEAELGLTLEDFAVTAHTVEEATTNGAVTHYAIRVPMFEASDSVFVRLRANLSED